MKKLILTFIVILICSCGVQKNIEKDRYIGAFLITVFDVDQIGDIPLKIIIKKDDKEYTSSINIIGDDSDNPEYKWEVDSTIIEDDQLIIQSHAGGYDIDFELNIDGNEVSGNMMGMFDVEGRREK
tara:strand:+ start:930 stop:1307 length:378 start_codon:yes stop_codon:yes gene_type:complete